MSPELASKIGICEWRDGVDGWRQGSVAEERSEAG